MRSTNAALVGATSGVVVLGVALNLADLIELDSRAQMLSISIAERRGSCWCTSQLTSSPSEPALASDVTRSVSSIRSAYPI